MITPLVLLRRQLALRRVVEKIDAAENDHGEHRGYRQVVQAAVQRALVAAVDGGEPAVDETDQTRLPFRQLPGGPQQARGHHRRQCQRDDGGDGDRADQGEGELGEQRAGQAALESDRHIDRDQHHRHGDDRAGQLARRLDRGRNWFHAIFEMAIDVLHHDDGVVHHQPDGQHQRQQGQQVDGEAEHQHDGEGADQRQRNCHHRDQHRARRAQEDEHHEGDDQHRLTRVRTTSLIELLTNAVES